MMAGSISESVAVIRVLTSSSKNSATQFNIAGSAPVDSPTSIMSVASAGKHARAFKRAGKRLSFPTLLPAASTAVSQQRRVQGIRGCFHGLHRGMPPVSKVLRMRESCATWYFIQISPAIGKRILTRSMRIRAASPFAHQRKQKNSGHQSRDETNDVAARGGSNRDQPNGHGGRLRLHRAI